RDHLGKFDGKANEGYFVGYSVEPKITLLQVMLKRKKNLNKSTQKEKEPEQEYTLIPLYTTDPLISQGPKDSEGDAGMKPIKIEHTNSTNNINTVSTSVNTVGHSVSTSNAFEEHLFERFSPFKNAFTLPPVLNVSSMDNTGIFGNAYDDEDLEEEIILKIK
ncbi:hypothetical protein Tco_0118542, partial [Tanacetum coccineum]